MTHKNQSGMIFQLPKYVKIMKEFYDFLSWVRFVGVYKILLPEDRY